ncbi:MAG TPA: putative metal-dependent hydrolase [Acidobacteriaceae bacterium]
MGTSVVTTLANAEQDPRYPIGKFKMPADVTQELRVAAIRHIASLPEKLRNAVDDLTPEQADTPYREGGWTVRQLVHHVADSHAQAFMRLRWALTEEWPTVMGYDEKAWAELQDSVMAPVEWSLEIIEATHARWGMLLSSLGEGQWQRGFKHAERGPSTIEQATLLYAWHGAHHTAHITQLRANKGW